VCWLASPLLLLPLLLVLRVRLLLMVQLVQ
jgi:hypothetical protein